VAKPVVFFYGLGSRYSYLASTQIAQLEADTGCKVRWRPLYSADLFAKRGRNPFEGQPVSGQYEWAYRRRDAERWAAYYGVTYREPKDLCFDPRRLALACAAAEALGAVEAFSRRLFQALFVDGTSPLDDEVCAGLAREIGLAEDAFRAALGQPETAARLTATVEEAAVGGVFGVPSFVVGGEVYFGNDRLPLVSHALLQENR
jgi:2-hydroxychromene-2-carboxylate isomerase